MLVSKFLGSTDFLDSCVGGPSRVSFEVLDFRAESFEELSGNYLRAAYFIKQCRAAVSLSTLFSASSIETSFPLTMTRSFNREEVNGSCFGEMLPKTFLSRLYRYPGRNWYDLLRALLALLYDEKPSSYHFERARYCYGLLLIGL